METRAELLAAGFDDVGVHARRIYGTKLSEDVLEVVLIDDRMGVEEATRSGARIVWEEFPYRFDRLFIEFDGRAYELTYAELESKFGPRPERLDEVSVEEAVEEWLMPALASVLTPIAVILLVIALAVAVIVRRNLMKLRQA